MHLPFAFIFRGGLHLFLLQDMLAWKDKSSSSNNQVFMALKQKRKLSFTRVPALLLYVESGTVVRSKIQIEKPTLRRGKKGDT